MLNLHFLPTGKNIVHKSSICPPTWLPFLKLCIQSSLQVFPCMVNGLIQILLDSQDYLQGTLPHLPVLVRWTLQFQFGPLPFQLLVKLRCQISPMLPSHTQIECFRRKMWIHLSGAFCHCLRKLFSRHLLEIWVQILLLQDFFYNLCNCVGIHLLQFKTVFWLYWRAWSFLSLPRTM